MHEYLKAARDGAAKRIKDIESGEPHKKVDSSSWSPPEMEKADKQTGMRPVSPRQYKSGGKVCGDMTKKRADRKARKSGGSAMPPVDRLVNRDMKKANEYRDGEKHVGGMKRGGKIRHRREGGDTPYDEIGALIRRAQMEDNMNQAGPEKRIPLPPRRPAAPPNVYTGPRNPAADRMGPKYGGKIPTSHAKGGKVSKMEWEHSKTDLEQDKKLAKKHGMSLEAWEKSDLDAKHDKQQSTKGLKRGGEVGRELYVRENYPHKVPGASGGRTAKKRGGGVGKGKTNVNVIIHPHHPGMAMNPPMPIGGPIAPPPRPVALPPMGGEPMMPPMGGAPMGGGMPPMGAARPGMPPIGRKSGGRVESNANPKHIIDNAAGGGLGRLEKIKAYGLK